MDRGRTRFEHVLQGSRLLAVPPPPSSPRSISREARIGEESVLCLSQACKLSTHFLYSEKPSRHGHLSEHLGGIELSASLQVRIFLYRHVHTRAFIPLETFVYRSAFRGCRACVDDKLASTSIAFFISLSVFLSLYERVAFRSNATDAELASSRRFPSSITSVSTMIPPVSCTDVTHAHTFHW